MFADYTYTEVIDLALAGWHVLETIILTLLVVYVIIMIISYWRKK